MLLLIWCALVMLLFNYWSISVSVRLSVFIWCCAFRRKLLILRGNWGNYFVRVVLFLLSVRRQGAACVWLKHRLTDYETLPFIYGVLNASVSSWCPDCMTWKLWLQLRPCYSLMLVIKYSVRMTKITFWCPLCAFVQCPYLSLIHIWRCRRSYACRSRWSPYH